MLTTSLLIFLSKLILFTPHLFFFIKFSRVVGIGKSDNELIWLSSVGDLALKFEVVSRLIVYF